MRVTRRKLEEAGIGMSGLSSTSGGGTYGLARPPSYKSATGKGKGPDKERKQPAQAGVADIKIAGGGGKKKKKKRR